MVREMSVGDFVMFSNMESRYAKWFFGEFGTIESTNNGHARIRWNRSIMYHGRQTCVSDFAQTNFTQID